MLSLIAVSIDFVDLSMRLSANVFKPFETNCIRRVVLLSDSLWKFISICGRIRGKICSRVVSFDEKIKLRILESISVYERLSMLDNNCMRSSSLRVD